VSPAIEWTGVDLRIREAVVADPSGALILNHGRGADENDLYSLLDELDPERRLLGITTGGPWYGIPPGGRHWYVVERVGYPHPDTFGRSYEALAERLDALLAERGIDWSKTVVGGFSQGTVMSYALALGADRPVPAGLVAMSGFIPEVEGWQADLATRTRLPVYIHHGAGDPVISVDFARAARTTLAGAGIGAGYRETSAGHWLPPEIVGELRDFVAAAVPTGAAAPEVQS
jgi:phospholipase/carboxylesterase